jgi:arsenate reductase
VDKPYNVLFLCTHNSARSVLSEAIMNRIGAGKFVAYSAGSQPRGAINPNSIKLLDQLGYDTGNLRSKSWDEFAKPGAPEIDFIFTVCDDAAGEVCPVWPGKPLTAHWGVADPSAVKGSDLEVAMAFQEAYRLLYRRIELFAALPIRGLDTITLKARLREIGREQGATEKAKSAT